MAIVTSGEDDVISLSLTWPRVGVWSADVLFDDPSPRSGRVTLAASSGARFSGTIVRGGDWEDADRTRVVAGNNGMGLSARPAQYQSTTARVVVQALLAAAGEVLAQSADQKVLGAAVAQWTTSAEPVGNVLTALMTTVGGGATWRMLPDGTVWVGTDSWPDSGLDPEDYQVLDKRFEDGSWLVSVDEAAVCTLAPGTTLEGARVSLVVHRVDDEEEPGPRFRVWFSDKGETSLEDRLDAAIDAVVRGAGAPPVDYRALYRARVVAQAGSTVHVEPEIVGTIPDMGSIPLYVGLPGISVDGVQAGSVLVGWRGGDRSKAYALCFDMSCQVSTMVLAVLVQLSLGAAGAPPAIVGAPKMAAEQVLVTASIAAFTALSAASTGPLAPLQAQFTALASAWTAYQAAAAAANGFLSKKVGIAP